MKGYIYTLSCAEYGGIFYAGSTRNFILRARAHKSNFQNKKLLIEVLEEIDFTQSSEMIEREGYWIEQLRQWGFSLKNRSLNKSFSKSDSDTTYIRLSDVPADVKDLIEREQARMKLEENKKLKQRYVIYAMLMEWYKQKTIIEELKNKIDDKSK